MLSLILLVAIVFLMIYRIKKKKHFSENFLYALFICAMICGGLWGRSISYIYFYDENAADIRIYEEKIHQLELELNENEILIENTSLRSDLTVKEIEVILDGISVKNSKLYEQIASYNAKLDVALHYNNPEILKISKFLIYFGWN